MPIDAKEAEQYTVRRKFLKLFGAAFHVYDEHGSVIGYCKQKAFKLKEDIRLYTDESMGEELLTLRARSVIDFSVTFDVMLPNGTKLGSLRRAGLKSTFLRDEWSIFDPAENPLGTIKERNALIAILRRGDLSLLFPQRFDIFKSGEQEPIAALRQHFNWFIYRLGLTVHRSDQELDELLLLGATCLMAAIEGRQS